MTRSQKARDLKWENPRLSSYAIAMLVDLDPRAVRKALRRRPPVNWRTRMQYDAGRERPSAEMER